MRSLDVVYKMTLKGKLVGVLGGTGRQQKEFGWIHEIVPAKR
jgi:hypothetical protein